MWINKEGNEDWCYLGGLYKRGRIVREGTGDGPLLHHDLELGQNGT